REKAGVGSAINDTTRQVGGALGVAIIGSVVSGMWASGIADAARDAGMNETSTARAEESLANALSEASTLGDGAGRFVAEAKDTFVAAMTTGMRVSVVVVLLAVLVAWKFLPNRAVAERGASQVAEPERVSTGELAVNAGD